MLGAANVVSPTLSSLSDTFGLEQLIGKLVAIISDARVSARMDSDAVVERLLNISGEDAVSVNRKNKSFWHGQLLVRVIMLANGLPRFKDPSGAFASRFIILRLTKSFLGHEDLTLSRKLLLELPGILNWSIAGWERILERKYFNQPDSAAADVKQMSEMVSPIGMFVRECCVTGGGYAIVKGDLYDAWKGWCVGQGREPGSTSTFGRTLKEVVPSLGEMRPGTGTDRREHYIGIRLRPVV
jgi:putative DNA primase/helicase